MTLPEDFIKNTKAALGDRLFDALRNGLEAEAPASIRLNPWKCDGDDGMIEGCPGQVPWCRNGYYLKSRPNFTFDPMLHAGLYYVQEASSMFLHHVLGQLGGTPTAVLDLCAAPGGKSTVARSVLPEGCLLVSNEPIRQRAQVLAENMQKFGHPDVVVTNNYPEDFKGSGLMFDIIIADVPCSGEGMFRKDPAAIGEWSVQNVEKCWRLQRSIVESVWDNLKPGGLLVYSTCTFNTKENEENVRYICEELGAEALAVDTAAEWHITGSVLPGFDKPVYRFLPGVTEGEGLFMAAMRKHGEHDGQPCTTKKDNKKKKERNKPRAEKQARPDGSWLLQPDSYDIIDCGNKFTAVPKAWRGMYDKAAKSLKILSAGVPLGEVKGKDIIPDHALALSTCLDTAAFATAELDYGQALSYLRKEAVALPADTPRGYVIVTYKGVPLGFEKNIGNRANNLYPAEWKIKSPHTPEGLNEVIRKRQTGLPL